MALGHELVLAGSIMHEQRISIATRAERKRLAGADSDHVNVEPLGRAKDRNDVGE